MKLLINSPFELDVELVDQMPSYLKVSRNWVSRQLVELPSSEMPHLINLLNYCSPQFNNTAISIIDKVTLAWG